MAFGDLKGVLTGSANSISTSAPIDTLASGSAVVAVGDIIVAIFGEQTTATTTTCGDNLHGAATYSDLQNAVDAGTSTCHGYYKVVTVAGTITAVTAVANGGTSNFAGIAGIYRGPFKAAPLDADPAHITSDATSPFTCPATGTMVQKAGLQAVVVSFGVHTGNATWSATSPNLLDGNIATQTILGVALGHQIVSVNTTLSPEFTGTNPTDCVLGTASFMQSDFLGVPLTNTSFDQSDNLLRPRARRAVAAALVASGAVLVHIPPPGDGIGAVPSGNFDTPRIQSLRYQVSTEPVLATASAETITADKWHRPLSEPTRSRPGLAVNSQQSTASAQAAPFLTADRWYRPLSEPTRSKPSPSAQQAATLVKSDPFPESVSIDRWLRPLGEPTRLRPGPGTSLQSSPPLAEAVSIGNWLQRFSEPPMRGVRPQQGAFTLVAVQAGEETVSIDRWLQRFSEPVRSRLSILAASQQAVAMVKSDPFPESVSIDRWLHPFSIPVRSRQTNWLQQPLSFVHQPPIGGWQTALSEPVRSRPGLPPRLQQAAALVQAAPFPETVSTDRWLLALSEPTRKTRTIWSETTALVPVITAAETITVDKWFAALRDPTRRIGLSSPWQLPLSFVYVTPVGGDGIGAVPSGIFVTPRIQSFQYQVSTKPVETPAAAPETVTVDKWYAPLSQRTDRAFSVIDTSFDFIAIDDLTGDGIGAVPSGWAVPPVVQSFRYQISAMPVSTPAGETVTPDKWFKSLAEATRRTGLRPHQQQASALVQTSPFAETVSIDRWLRPFSDPIRIRRARGSENYAQVLVSTETITIDKWYAWLSEPARSRPGISVPSQSAAALVQAAPFAETVSIDRWLRSFSEPTRIRFARGPDAAQALIPQTETITTDKWYAWLSEPTRSRTGLSAASQQSFAIGQAAPFAEGVWWQQWLSEPVRSRPGLAAALQQFQALVQAAPFPESVSVDRWLQPYSIPIRILRGSGPDAALVIPVAAEIVTSDKWYQWFSEPVRSRPGLLAALQRALALVQSAPFEESVSVDRWLRALTDNPRLRVHPTSLYLPAAILDPFPLPNPFVVSDKSRALRQLERERHHTPGLSTEAEYRRVAFLTERQTRLQALAEIRTKLAEAKKVKEKQESAVLTAPQSDGTGAPAARGSEKRLPATDRAADAQRAFILRTAQEEIDRLQADELREANDLMRLDSNIAKLNLELAQDEDDVMMLIKAVMDGDREVVDLFKTLLGIK